MNEIGWRVQLGAGMILGGMAAAAVRVDVLNNLEYGLTVSAECATVMVLAAFGVAIIPVAAAVLGWSRHLRITAFICVALTVWSAINAYSEKQGAKIHAAEGVQEAKQDVAEAREQARKDRAEAEKIAETASASAIESMVNQAQSKVNDLTKRAEDIGTVCARYKACNDAGNELKALRERQGNAQTKQNLLASAKRHEAVAEKAKTEAKAGPSEASMIATVIARQFSKNANDIARHIALSLTGLIIAVTQLVALLGGHAATLISRALKTRSAKRPAQRQKPKLETPPPAKRKTQTRKLGANVVRLQAARPSVERWLGTVNDGGEMRAGDALKAYKRHAGRLAGNMTAAEFQVIVGEILGKEAVVKRASGYVIVGRSLRAPSLKVVSG